MLSTTILSEPWDVDRGLRNLGLDRDDILAVVAAAVSARNDASPLHPANSAGQLAYIFGTGAIRHILIPKGWNKDQTDNIEGTIHPKLGIRLVYQNTDTACVAGREPKAISKKGAGSRRLVNNTPYLFSDWEEEDKQRACSTYYLCVSANEDGITAEVSRPQSIEGDQFQGFVERIFVVMTGDLDDLWPTPDIEDFEPQEIDVEVTRK